MNNTKKINDITFMKHFGTKNVFEDVFISKITGKYCFDVIKFDDWLHKYHGYNEDIHGSARDFVMSKFGNEPCKFIEDLLNA